MRNVLCGFIIAVCSSFAFGIGGDMGASTDPLTDGSADHPWLIEDFGDFEEFASDPNYWASGVYTRLESDIDLDPGLQGRQIYTQSPIAGDTDTDEHFDGIEYRGFFDGNNYVVKNLTINGSYWCGLFGKIYIDGEIINLGTEDVSITGSGYYLGGLCGKNYNAKITGCYSTGNVTGGESSAYIGMMCGKNYGKIRDSYVTGNVTGGNGSGNIAGGNIGGMCGYNGYSLSMAGVLRDCYAECSVTGGENSYNIGGLCGRNGYGGKIIDCHSNSTVNGGFGSYNIGGLCGQTWESITINCYATGEVNGDSSGQIGGLCGENDNGEIINCYSTGSVSGGGPLGGLCGKSDLGVISECYSTGSLNGSSYIGGLCGINNSGSISNCYANGSIISGDDSCNIGGLIGENNLGDVNNCYAITSVVAGLETYNLGGLCGRNNDGSIINCYSIGEVTGNGYAGGTGGLCGYNEYGTISHCYANCDVSGITNLGGLCGDNLLGTISNCYSNGSVSGENYMGGLCGTNSGVISKSYAAGMIIELMTGSQKGGMCSNNNGTITGCFWDIYACGAAVSEGGTGLFTDQMIIKSTYTDAGWDFLDETINGPNDIWRMCVDGVDYPKLTSIYIRNGDILCSDGVDVNDLNILAAEWLMEGECHADTNFDNIVNIYDLGIIAMNWLSVYEYPDFAFPAHWPMDGNADDVSYYQRDGIVHGDPVWRDGHINEAIQLDGDGDFVSTSFVVDPSIGSFSVFAWIKGGANGQCVISQADNEYGAYGEIGRVWLRTDTSGYFSTALREPGGNALVSAYADCHDAQWHHIGLAWDGARRTLYTDGAAVASDSSDLSGLEPCTGSMYIGTNKEAYDKFWDGKIDDLRIYNRALSDSEVAGLVQ